MELCLEGRGRATVSVLVLRDMPFDIRQYVSYLCRILCPYPDTQAVGLVTCTSRAVGQIKIFGASGTPHNSELLQRVFLLSALCLWRLSWADVVAAARDWRVPPCAQKFLPKSLWFLFKYVHAAVFSPRRRGLGRKHDDHHPSLTPVQLLCI